MTFDIEIRQTIDSLDIMLHVYLCKFHLMLLLHVITIMKLRGISIYSIDRIAHSHNNKNTAEIRSKQRFDYYYSANSKVIEVRKPNTIVRRVKETNKLALKCLGGSGKDSRTREGKLFLLFKK